MKILLSHRKQMTTMDPTTQGTAQQTQSTSHPIKDEFDLGITQQTAPAETPETPVLEEAPKAETSDQLDFNLDLPQQYEAAPQNIQEENADPLLESAPNTEPEPISSLPAEKEEESQSSFLQETNQDEASPSFFSLEEPSQSLETTSEAENIPNLQEKPLPTSEETELQAPSNENFLQMDLQTPAPEANMETQEI